VPDLTPADVQQMKTFLLNSCQDVMRLLPPPQWEATWRSDAAAECANAEIGASGPWGESPVRTVYAGGALYLDTILRCLAALGDALSPQTTPYVLEAIARSAMEAGAVLWWLLEPAIGARRRVIRFWLIRASGARYLDSSSRRVDPKAPAGTYGQTPEAVREAMADLGLTLNETETRHKDRKTGTEWSTWNWSCETEKLPSYTARARQFEAAVKMSAAYAIYSAAAHAEWHAVIAGWRHEPLPDGSTVLVSRPDLVAAGGAVIASAGFAVVPAHRALRLLGRTARVAELAYHARRADDMIHDLGLPEDWSRWRR
jgi:hypothetical protein